MVDEGFDDGGRRGHHVGAGEGAELDVVGGADRGGEDFGVEQVVVIDLADLVDQVHAVEVDVVEAADEGRDEGRAGFRREQRLVGGEAERDVDLRALPRQRLAGLQAVERQRQLDRDVGGDLGELAAFLDHAVIVGRDDFGADRAGGERADLGDHLGEGAAGLGNQRRVGGHPVDEAGGGEVGDVFRVGSVDEEFHGWGFRSDEKALALP